MKGNVKTGQRSENSELALTYFEIQAYLGTTKHMGGLETTDELVALCHIDRDTRVLDVGCGVGATACYLAKRYGCHVVGVDLRERMIARSRERAQREGIVDRVEFRAADARDLPFQDASFGAVLCESVATFIEDKEEVVSELARLVAPGGYVGLNEEVWLQPPPADVVEYAQRTWDIHSDILTADKWGELLRGAGLEDVVVRSYRVDTRREATQVKRYSAGDMWRMLCRTVSLYLSRADFREYMRRRQRVPRGLFTYLGYGVFAGRRGEEVR